MKEISLMAKNVTRREFLKGMAAGAVSMAGLGVLAACGTTETAASATAAPTAVPEATAVVKESAAAIYTPGTYTASSKGIASDVTVTMTFSETEITAVSIDVSGETPSIGGAIGGTMEEAILAAQSADVDAVASATVTSTAIRKAAADCISQASGKEVSLSSGDNKSGDWLGEAPEISEAEIAETLETEVLVVGCGTGGWITAMSAAEEGAKVLVVERNENPTGIREDIGAIDSKLQLESFKKYPEFKIDRMEALQEIVRYGAGYVDGDLVKVWINNSAEMVDWLTELMESTGDWYMSFEGGVGNTKEPGRDKAFATGHSPHKTEQGVANEVTTSSTFRAYCDQFDVEWLTSTKLIKLEQDANDKVTGIIAQNAEGKYIRINASKGVIMCSGGYATNTEMMKALQPETLDMKVAYTLGSTCDGSGIKAMMWAGAALNPVHASMMFNRCCVLPTETAGYETSGKWFWFGEQPFLKVNLNGKRFCNESGPYEFMLHSMEMQPGFPPPQSPWAPPEEPSRRPQMEQRFCSPAPSPPSFPVVSPGLSLPFLGVPSGRFP